MKTVIIKFNGPTKEQNEMTSKAEEEAKNLNIVESYLPLVKRVVKKIIRNLPSHIDSDDLHSVGVIGLIAATEKYDPVQGHTFEAYATMRVRGAILDELRRLDNMPRTARAKFRQLQKTVGILEQRFGRTPEDEEIREEMGQSTKEFKRMMKQVMPVNFISLDRAYHVSEIKEPDLHEALADDQQIPSWELMQREEMRELMTECLKQLPDRQKKILSMYYFEDMRLGEIAEVFCVTEARICQIHAKAVAALRNSVYGAMNR
jgi:RNA polymerase sigma factor for flagellar operon FliA